MITTPDEYLSANRVRVIYAGCFRREGWNPMKSVVVEGALLRHTLSLKMLQHWREDIIKLLLCLPAGFRVDEGAGGSVMMLNQRANRTIWTTDLTDTEKLIALGLGVGLLSFCATRANWSKLPGGVPYVRVEITRFGVSVN